MKTKQQIPLKKRLRRIAGNIVYKKRKLMPRADKGFRLLAYHSITEGAVKDEWQENSISRDLFEAQMEYLADNNYNVISCRDAVEYLIRAREIPEKTIAISFDDGYRDNYLEALPVLKKYNFCATIFLAVNFLRDFSGDGRYLSCYELIDAKESGLIEFGSHGLSHKILTGLGEDELEGEIRGAKKKLEEITNDKINLFAYPFGHSKSYNKRIARKIESAGFKGACTTIFGLNTLKTHPFFLRRNRISWLDNLDEFEKHLLGAYDWCALCEFFRRKRFRY